ncbi:MAG: acyl--CoA ligase [Peptostreptococcaceae bacterium]|nr:acyl--CoA ligase [Peptostreptococcaceae bacterium]
MGFNQEARGSVKMAYTSIVNAIYSYSITKPRSLAVIDEKTSLTYEQFWSRIMQTAGILRSNGVGKGDFVLIESTQDTNYSVFIFAVHLLSAISIPLEEGIGEANLNQIIEETGSNYFIGKDFIKYDNLTVPFKDDFVFQTDLDVSNFNFPDPSDIAEILFSTGTTGKSKGIELNHSALVAVAENVIFGVQMKKGNVELIPSPLSHSHGLRRHYANLLAGNTVVIVKSVLNVKNFFSLIDKYSVTAIDLVPTALSIILKISKRHIGNYKERLDYMQFGTAPLNEADKVLLCELLPNTRLYNIYGSTEAGCACIIDFNEFENKINCVGKPTINSICKVVNDENEEILSSESNTGHLAFSGGMLMNRYVNDSELTEQYLINDIMHSSDIGYIDSEGFIYFLGRKDNVINIGGIKVSPEEIEQVAINYNDIDDCACISKENSLGDPRIILFVKPTKLKNFDKNELFDYLNIKLDKNKLPREIVIVDDIPRTFNGKLMRKELTNIDKAKAKQ